VSGSPDRGRRWRRNERGAELVEFSLVFVLFVFICYALVAFGLAMNLKSNLTHATAEGARTAVGAGLCTIANPDPAIDSCAATKIQAAKDRTVEAMKGQSDNIWHEVENKVTAAIATCDAATTAYCITVKVPYDYGAHPIVPSAPGLGIVMPSTLQAESIVQLTK
jgi:Flp pilus assembly protein TadG